jgi:hypothetical protein
MGPKIAARPAHGFRGTKSNSGRTSRLTLVALGLSLAYEAARKQGIEGAQQRGHACWRAPKTYPGRSCFPDELRGGEHVVKAEALPFPSHDVLRQHELRDPLAHVPSEPSDLEPSGVAIEFGNGHAPGGEAASQLLDEIFLVAALVGPGGSAAACSGLP